jgi:hypothetical protein
MGIASGASRDFAELRPAFVPHGQGSSHALRCREFIDGWKCSECNVALLVQCVRVHPSQVLTPASIALR